MAQSPDVRLVTEAALALFGGGLPARVSAVEAKNTAQDEAITEAKTDAIADATTKYGGLPARVSSAEEKNAAQDLTLSAHQALLGTAVFDFDTRLFEVADTESKDTFAVVDRHDRLVQSSRTPEEDAETESGESVAVIDRHDRAIFTPEGNATSASSSAYPSQGWAHWGDSLTYTDYSGIPGAWVTQLAALTGRIHFNGGWSGQTTDQIAARQGGLPSMITVEGNTIPASGSVSVTLANPKPVRQAASRFVMGTLAGIPGKFQEVTSNVVTFTRTSAGVATSCPPGTLFLPDDAPAYADRTVTIWTGRNDVYTATPAAIVERIRAMIQYLTPRVKRIMVLEIPPSETSTATHSLLLAMNNAIKAAFPEQWVPIATYLRSPEAATAAGITFSTDDQADIAAGITPRSFRVDTMHFNATACTAIAKFVYAEAQRRIWL